jgi:hypothetical protein
MRIMNKCIPVYDTANGNEFVGVIGADISLDKLANRMDLII